MKFLPLFLVLFFFNYGCDLETNNQQKPTSDPTVPAQVPGENKPNSGDTSTEPTMEEIEENAQNLSVSSFNETVKTASYDQPTWANSPILTALKYSGEGMDCRHKTIDVKSLSGGESFTKVLVTITKDGFLDDSIRGDVTFIRMEKVDGHWELISAKKAWKCWKNRGHEDFSTEPCG